MVAAIWGKVLGSLGLDDLDGGKCGDITSAEHNPLHVVTAALMVHVSVEDGGVSDVEREGILRCLEDHFGLDDVIAQKIFDQAVVQHSESVDLHGFTRVIMDALEQDGQQEIVRLLYRVAFADHDLDHFEDQVITKISGLLGVSVRDRVQIKQDVRAEVGGEI